MFQHVDYVDKTGSGLNVDEQDNDKSSWYYNLKSSIDCQEYRDIYIYI